MNDLWTPWNVLAAVGALLAFLIGLYTLVGRERKSPYLINSIFGTFLVGVLSATFSVASVLVPGLGNILLTLATALLLVALFLTAWRIWKLYIRFARFVSRVDPFELFRRGETEVKRYEHSPDEIGQELLDQVVNILQEPSSSGIGWVERSVLGRTSLTVALDHQGQATDVLVRLAVAFLQAGHSVQYLTASRHPVEFVRHLKDVVAPENQTAWVELAQRVVVVDAFTPHFGFTDSIHKVKTKEVEGMDVKCIPSAESYAGMHTAASDAFKLIKDRAKSGIRAPTLVIYEDTRAVADLESAEQYRIFVRHVIPSERMWGGMFTVFTEVSPPDDDWQLLSAYGAFKVDMRAARVVARSPGDVEK